MVFLFYPLSSCLSAKTAVELHGNITVCVIWNRVTVRSKKGEMSTWFDWEGVGVMGYLNKVALAHFDLADLLKSNYFDPRSLAHAAAESAVDSGIAEKCEAFLFFWRFRNNNMKTPVFSSWQKRTKRTISRHHVPDVIESHYQRYNINMYCSFIFLSPHHCAFFPFFLISLVL